MTKAKSGTRFDAEYREYVRTTPEWALIDDLAHLRKVIRWLPGSISGAAIGFLNVVPVAAWTAVLSALFKGEPPETYVAQIWALGMLSIVIHCFFMFSMNIGFVWGQKYLVRYLWGVNLFSVTLLAAAIYSKAQPFVIGFAFVGLAVAAFMLSLARGKRFTAYAEIMRVKRIYMQERREMLASLLKRRRSSRGRARK
jgi:hypothetical protein